MSVNRMSLEAQFEKWVVSDVNVQQECEFDFLTPNELSPGKIKAHMDLAEKGVYVSTGTIRNLYYLVYADVEKCEGIVIREVAHRAKAFLDFKVCLIRISNTHEEYLNLSEPMRWKSREDAPWQDDNEKNAELINNRVVEIAKKIHSSNIPERIQTYYLKHLHDFAKLYFESGTFWITNQAYQDCNYERNEAHFYKVQKYARVGNIIATIGDINDLKFLAPRKISFVDTSNISDYIFIDLQVEGKPRVVRVTISHNYMSHTHTPLSPAQREEFDAIIKKDNKPDVLTFVNLLEQNKPGDQDPFDDHYWPDYSPTTLSILKQLTNHSGSKRPYTQ